MKDPQSRNYSVTQPENEMLTQLRSIAQEAKLLLSVSDNGRYLAPPRLALAPSKRESFHQALSVLQQTFTPAEFNPQSTVSFVTSNELNANAAIQSLFNEECSNLPAGKIRVAILVGSSNLPSILPELLKHADIVLFCDRNPLMLEHNQFNIDVLRSCRVGLDYLERYFDPQKNPWLINRVQTGMLAYYQPGTKELISTTESKAIDADTLKEMTISYLATAFKTTTDEEDPVNCAFLPDEDRFQFCALAARMLSFQSLQIDLFNLAQVQHLKKVLDEQNAVVTVCNVSSLFYYDGPTNFSPMPQPKKTIWKCSGNLLRSLQALTDDQTCILFSQYQKVGSHNLYSQITRGWKSFMAIMLKNVKELNMELVPAEIIAASRQRLAQELGASSAITPEPISAHKTGEAATLPSPRGGKPKNLFRSMGP